jgi:hypothetical protein
MKARLAVAGLGVAVALGLGPPVPVVAQEAAPAPSEPGAAGPGSLDLSIRARGLGLGADHVEMRGLADLDTVRAPTASSARMPQQVTGRDRRGAYIGIVVCDPDGVERLYMVRLDDPGTLPEGPIRTGAAGPQGLYLPGRPLP